MKKRKRKNGKGLLILLVLIIAIVAIIVAINNKPESEKNQAQEVAQQNVITDAEAPKLILNGDDVKIVPLGGKYENDTASATDNIDGNVSENIKIEEEVNINKEGTYQVKYSVTDKSGNTTTKEQKVIVCKPLSEAGLPVLMYHFFYDGSLEDGSSRDNNYIEISKFEEQIKYLKENNFYFPTWEEVEKYIDGDVILPEKSVVLTFDDGDDSFFELAVPILQKYNVNGTSFVISSWYGYRAEEKETNVIYESHSDNMHQAGANGKGVMLSWSNDKIKEDLINSRNVLGENVTVFCYPMGNYNENAKQLLKETGYKLAFTTEGGRVKKGADKYALPRVRISKNTSLASFKSMVN